MRDGLLVDFNELLNGDSTFLSKMFRYSTCNHKLEL